jgi:Spy/CpxP family protein refolding chaperone
MKILSMAALVVALAFAPAAFAQQAAAPTATNKVDCEKAKMKWDEKGGKDSKGACVAATPAPAKAGETPKK